MQRRRLQKATLLSLAACLILAAAAPAASASADGTRSTTVGSLRLTTPEHLVAGQARLRVSARFEHVGWLDVTLLRGKERIARGRLIATSPRTVGLALKVPKTLRPGPCRLTARYRPLGERARARRLRLTVRPVEHPA